MKDKELKFNKNQLLESKMYMNKRDILNVILKDNSYTLTEVNDLIKKFMKGKVK